MSVCLSADGRFALSGSEDKTLKLWDVGSGKCLRTFSGHTEHVESVCLSADGSFALSGSKDKTLKLWDVGSGKCLRTFSGHTKRVNSVCLSADGRCFQMDSGSINILQLPTGRTTASWYVSPVGAAGNLISAGAAYRKALVDAEHALLRYEWCEGRRLIESARSGPFRRDPDAFALWTRLYCRMRKTRLRDHWHRELLGVQVGYAFCLSANGRFALSGVRDGRLKLWDVGSGRCLRTFSGHTGRVASACLSADDRFALSGSDDKTLKLWDLGNGACLRTFSGHFDDVTAVFLSADGRFALSGSRDWTVKVWDTGSGECLRTLRGHADKVSTVCLSADGRFALSCSADSLRLWDLVGYGYRTLLGHTGNVCAACLSADDRFALSGDDEGELRLWNVGSGACLRIFSGHTGGVMSVCLSADGRFALSGSDDMTLKLWNVGIGECLRTFSGHTASVDSVYLSVDGSFVLSTSRSVLTGRSVLTRWTLDWDLEDHFTADRDEGAGAGARPYLEAFLRAQQPYIAGVPGNHTATEGEITQALVRSGPPHWSDSDFERLLYTLGCAGYGWLGSERVRKELDGMVAGAAYERDIMAAPLCMSREEQEVAEQDASIDLKVLRDAGTGMRSWDYFRRLGRVIVTYECLVNELDRLDLAEKLAEANLLLKDFAIGLAGKGCQCLVDFEQCDPEEKTSSTSKRKRLDCIVGAHHHLVQAIVAFERLVFCSGQADCASLLALSFWGLVKTLWHDEILREEIPLHAERAAMLEPLADEEGQDRFLWYPLLAVHVYEALFLDWHGERARASVLARSVISQFEENMEGCSEEDQEAIKPVEELLGLRRALESLAGLLSEPPQVSSTADVQPGGQADLSGVCTGGVPDSRHVAHELPAPPTTLSPPTPSPAGASHTPRNAPCPCGSGRRYKECHGRL